MYLKFAGGLESARDNLCKRAAWYVAYEVHYIRSAHHYDPVGYHARSLSQPSHGVAARMPGNRDDIRRWRVGEGNRYRSYDKKWVAFNFGIFGKSDGRPALAKSILILDQSNDDTTLPQFRSLPHLRVFLLAGV